MYLHMIVPAPSHNHKNRLLVDKLDQSSKTFTDEEKDDHYTNDKKVFYEVGCKIFEINKIYK